MRFQVGDIVVFTEKFKSEVTGITTVNDEFIVTLVHEFSINVRSLNRDGFSYSHVRERVFDFAKPREILPYEEMV